MNGKKPLGNLGCRGHGSDLQLGQGFLFSPSVLSQAETQGPLDLKRAEEHMVFLLVPCSGAHEGTACGGTARQTFLCHMTHVTEQEVGEGKLAHVEGIFFKVYCMYLKYKIQNCSSQKSYRYSKGSFPRWPQLPGLGQIEARSLELLKWVQGIQAFGHLLLSRCIGRELDASEAHGTPTRVSWDANVIGLVEGAPSLAFLYFSIMRMKNPLNAIFQTGK